MDLGGAAGDLHHPLLIRRSGDTNPNWPVLRPCGHIPSQYFHAPFAPPKLPRPVKRWGGLDTAGVSNPSNFFATSLRYQARMASDLATQATSRSALRPTRPPDLGEPWDHSTAISMAASPSEYGSPRPNIHSAVEAPGSPIPSGTPAVETTSCSSCRLPILLWPPSFQFLDHSRSALARRRKCPGRH
jgi:hypothetical protein